MSAASWSGDLRRGTNASGDRAGDEQRLAAPAGRLQVRDARGVVLAPVPDRERRVAVRAASRTCGPRRPGPRASGSGSSRRTEKAASVATREAGGEAQRRRGRGAPPGTTPRAARASSARELRPAGERDERAARARPSVASQKPQIRKRRHDRVVRVRARDVLRERVRGPGERRASPRAACPPKRRPTSASPSSAEQVEQRSR